MILGLKMDLSSNFKSFFVTFSVFRKDKEISVVFGAKNLKNYDGERYDKVSVHKKDYDRLVL